MKNTPKANCTVKPWDMIANLGIVPFEKKNVSYSFEDLYIKYESKNDNNFFFSI